MSQLPAQVPAPVVEIAATAFRNGTVTAQTRAVPEETAVALSYGRVGYAVMMTTPCDLIDFAIGFSLSEAIIDRAADIIACDLVTVEGGIECRMEVAHDVAARLAQRRRHLAGALGCGLCGLESLAEANRAIPRVTTTRPVTADAIMRAMRSLPLHQTLNRRTHGIHAAAFLDPADAALLVREDVGRHNALDKLIGALARQNRNPATGILLMTSRISIELIQKAAIAGIPVIVAVSVPTAHAIRAADAAGITLAAVARDDGFEIFTHQSRIEFGAHAHVA
ncbi:MAG: sulfurtransferase FdhD [Acidiphilium sp. 37-64-53]|uniref:formate dehydrogenase accessory sulfurtransferase FdhD n=1 Tax=Acidiphilium TaxID=522 RepID=UPI000BC3BFC1|nr:MULTISPECIES: formate dehydrogenase accessory sulfurtransferase FdhD [Acidiphilium]OYW03389.1 MAG: sulfurtransferase FdhD [Acidiphilium sp. 37-64-53]OZB30714.1 MAG: sulfurtransferase FdhD [Acidiphilium sp. 34-64-41]HQT84553.1 formate dehydrogenase accessory sulfurtransferase FdhD [Acidiphilium rubrum]